MIYAIHIINKAGGLAFQKDFNDGLAKLSSNDYLRLAGTFHGVHAITSKISPLAGSSGIESLETEQFKLTCSQVQTGTKFIVITDLNHHGVDGNIRRVYELYADYVMKNPFQNPEMPIRCDRFELAIDRMVSMTSG